MKRKSYGVIGWLLFSRLVLYVLLLTYLYLWGFITSLKTFDGFMHNKIGIPSGWPWEWEWGNYSRALELFSIRRVIDGYIVEFTFTDMLFNSLLYSALGPLITLSTTWVMAYITSTYNGRASAVIYRMNIVLMSIPIVGNLASSLQVYSAIGAYNNWGYVIISSVTFIGTNYLIFHAVLRGVSKELREAAQIDGANRMTVMLRIVFPLTINMYGILYLMAFISRWNDYMTMLLYMPDIPNLAFGIYSFSQNNEAGARYTTMQMAGCFIVVLPIFILFMIFRNKIIGKVTIGSFK